MRRINLIHTLLICLVAGFANAQVTQNVIVEHFTNTNCSVCGSRNPGFYTNLNQNPSIRHIAYHPSSPYASCFFSKQNKIENDDRTKYYGVFGGTPRLVIQGAAISASTDYASSSIFDAFLAKTTPVQIKTRIALKGSDSISVTVVIINSEAHTLGNLRLFAAVVEKEINFAAPNGEAKHHDVFRKSFFETIGKPITLSANKNDSVVYQSTVYKNAAWDNTKLYAIAIINRESDKTLIQTEQSPILSTASGLNSLTSQSFEVYPNPTSNQLTINLLNYFVGNLRIVDLTGKVVKEHTDFAGGDIDVSNLVNGIYLVQLGNNEQWLSKKFIKQQ
jgi:hypothetical protein